MNKQQIIFRGVDISTAGDKERLKERKIFEEASQLLTVPNNEHYKGMREEVCAVHTPEKLLSTPTRTYSVLSWGDKEYAIDEGLKALMVSWQDTAGDIFINLLPYYERQQMFKAPLIGATP